MHKSHFLNQNDNNQSSKILCTFENDIGGN
jgi:hypothetical protein